MNYYLVSYDIDKCGDGSNNYYEIVKCQSKSEAKEIVSNVFKCDPNLLYANKVSILAKEFNGKSLKDKLTKYHFPMEILDKLLKHLTSFEEHIDNDEITKFGDTSNLNIFVTYTYDGVDYDVGFYVDHSGNGSKWTWDDVFEYVDENDLHFRFRISICNYFDDHYTK